MIQTIALILLGISLSGMVFVLIRGKEKVEEKERSKQRESLKLKELTKFVKIPPFHFEKFLRKFLIRLKIVLLRWENKIDSWLRQVSHSKKFQDDYWEKFKE